VRASVRSRAMFLLSLCKNKLARGGSSYERSELET
jgi:hypothetical protein